MPGAEIDSTIILEISPIAICDGEPETIQAITENYCKNGKYKANVLPSGRLAIFKDEGKSLKSSTHSLQIFPNPASSIFNIQLSEADISNTSAVNLYDITGHLISQNKGYIKTLSTEALANGTYIVEVILNDNTKMNQRLVVTH